MMPATTSGPSSDTAPVEIRVTRTTTGASLRPDSASSVPVSRRGSGTTRSTENTAAASVAEMLAPSSTAISHGRSNTKCATRATTVTEIATPNVANATLSRMDPRMSFQLVVTPPSARMSTKAAKPRACASSASSNWIPKPDSPRATPISR